MDAHSPAFLPSARAGRGMRPEDIELLVRTGRPTLAPDGSSVVVATAHPDLGADAEVGQLWRVDLPDGKPVRISRGFRDSAPRFAPDGRCIAFLRSTRTGSPQLMVVPAAGGEPAPVTDVPLGVAEFAWSPDGRRLAFTTRVPEPGRYGTVAGLDPGAEPPRRFTTLRYRANGVGVTTDRLTRLFVVDVPDPAGEPAYEQAPRPTGGDEVPPPLPEPRRLETGDGDVSAPAFSVDGTAVLVVGALHETRDADLVSDVWRVPVDGGAIERLTDGRAAVVAFAEDGIRLLTVGVDLGGSGRDFVGRSAVLRIHREGDLRAFETDRPLDLAETATLILDETGGVLALDSARGAVDLVRVRPDGVVEQLTRDVETAGVDAAGGQIVVAHAGPDTAGEIGLVEEAGLRPLTCFGDPLRATGLAVPHPLVVRARDGAEVHGWVTAPVGEGPHPVLLMIHGGPFAQYGVQLFDETQVLVTAGYAVVQCNPRGSAGYGEEHARAIRQRMGTVDLTDVLDFLDGAIDRFEALDGERLGIMGGSYGGYLTAWAIAHDHRFAAAIVERGFLDPEAFVGTSDIGSFFGDEYVGTDPEAIRAQSPQAVVGQVRTPVLVLHSEQDLRCPLGQAERYYAALKRSGVEAELLVFPGEDHELSRSGRPRHRVQRFGAVLEWWHRHPPVSSAPA